MRIAVAGGTGAIGQHVVREARARGHEPVVLARSEGVDLTTGSGLEDRLVDVATVVDVTNIASQSRTKATAFFETVTRTLQEAERRAGVGHHLALSIVGIDRVSMGYYQAKLAQEHVVESGPVPCTILRATQFYEFVEQALRFAAIGPVSLVPRFPDQPVAAADVAATLLDQVESGPSGRVPDLAGPAVLDLLDLARRVNAAKGLGRRIVPVRMPGRAGRAMRAGGLLPDSDGPRGATTFDEWLAG
ncbi:conserved hypothetical protein [Nostocoides japonicum T1-X7]|uniref:NAD(P)-binding domain-containing protein n=1 Tax=Nostocoides japonicum T1-X7 TaxID=1194083 RepID=A0A077LWT2_9MICO|nr:SDR family oxidoreductase [Tetrasphaera japonica]CCH76464.1 conserved hypothetical protein [Tetrasphaera japonica T1-X7]